MAQVHVPVYMHLPDLKGFLLFANANRKPPGYVVVKSGPWHTKQNRPTSGGFVFPGVNVSIGKTV
jgi:hypothetical protein